LRIIYAYAEINKVEVMNITGKLVPLLDEFPQVRKKQRNETTVNIRHFPEGLYLLQLHLSNGTLQMKKMVKE